MTTTIDLELTEAIATVQDVSNTQPSEFWAKHDSQKKYNAKVKSFHERGLRTKKKLDKDQRAQYADSARKHSSVGKDEAYAMWTDRKVPNVVKRSRAPKQLPPKVPEQPRSRSSNIDEWIQGQSEIGDFGTGETRGNAQLAAESGGNPRSYPESPISRSYIMSAQTCLPDCQSVSLRQARVVSDAFKFAGNATRRGLVYGASPILSQIPLLANFYIKIPGNKWHCCIKCPFSAYTHEHLVMVAASPAGLMEYSPSSLSTAPDGSVGMIMDDKLMTVLGLLPGNRQTAVRCKFSKSRWPLDSSEENLRQFCNMEAFKCARVYSCKICAAQIFKLDTCYYHPGSQVEEDQMRSAEEMGCHPTHVDESDEKGKEKEKESPSPEPTTSSPTAPPPPTPPPTGPAATGPRTNRPLLGYELSDVEIQKMVHSDGRPSYIDSINVRRAIRRYSGDLRLVTESTIRESAFDYAVVSVEFDCVNLPLPKWITSLVNLISTRSWWALTRYMYWNAVAPIVLLCVFYWGVLTLIGRVFQLAQYVLIADCIGRVLESVIRSNALRSYCVRRRLLYVPHLVSCVVADLSLSATHDTTYDSVMQRIRVVSSFPVHDNSVAEELYGTAHAILAHVDARDFRMPVVEDPDLIFVPSFDPFLASQRRSPPGDSSQASKRMPTATGSTKSNPSQSQTQPPSKRGRQSTSKPSEKCEARTSDSSSREPSPASDPCPSTGTTQRPCEPHSSSGSQEKQSPRTRSSSTTSESSSKQPFFHFSRLSKHSSRSRNGSRARATPSNKKKGSVNFTKTTKAGTPPNVSVNECQASSSSNATETGRLGGSSTAASTPSKGGAGGSSKQ